MKADAEGFVAMIHALPALGETSKNPGRYLYEESDCPGKRWKLRPDNRAPSEGHDFKRTGLPQGGSANGKLVVKKTFLKAVALQNYRHKLRADWSA